MKDQLLASAAAALVIVGLGVGLVVGYYSYQTLGSTSPRVTTGPAGVIVKTFDDIVESAINSSSACSPKGSWENTSAMNMLRSNVMSQPGFVRLAQSRSFSDAGYGCSLNSSGNVTEFKVDFAYYDVAHPFHVCGNGTAYPTHQIDAKIYLLSTGYDLSKTTYTMRYYDSQNLTVSCTTTIAH